MSAKHQIEVTSKTPPVVELDSNARAAYIRFSKLKTVRTHLVACDKEVVTIDFAKDGSVVGIELVGVEEFTISRLMMATGVKVRKEMLENARYVSAKRNDFAIAEN